MAGDPDIDSRIYGVLKRHPGGLNIVEIAEKTGLNRMSVAKYLEVQGAHGIVEASTFGRARIYTLAKKIPISTYMEYTSKHYCITDENLVVVQLNEWIPLTVGVKYEDFIGRPLLDVLKDGVVNLDECRLAMEKALAGEVSTIVVEEDFQGIHKFFEILHMPIRFPDGSPGMMAVSQEITGARLREIELQQMAERFRNMVEHLPQVVVETGPDGIISYVSPRAADWGFVPGNLVDIPFADIALPEDRDRVLTGLSVVQQSLRGVMWFRAAVPGDRTLRLEADCRAIGRSGAGTGMICLLRDVTEISGQG